MSYRYFKELRNSLAHNGGRAGQRQLDAQSEFAQTILGGKIGSVKAPDYNPFNAVDEEVRPEYRGVIGFSEVILHLIATYDSVLSKTPIVENELRAALVPDKLTWSTSQIGKTRRFNKVFDRNNFPKFTPTPELVAFLKTEGLIPLSVNI